MGYKFQTPEEFFEEVSDLGASLKFIVPAEVAGGIDIVNMVGAASWSGKNIARKPKVCIKYLRTEWVKVWS